MRAVEGDELDFEPTRLEKIAQRFGRFEGQERIVATVRLQHGQPATRGGQLAPTLRVDQRPGEETQRGGGSIPDAA